MILDTLDSCSQKLLKAQERVGEVAADSPTSLVFCRDKLRSAVQLKPFGVSAVWQELLERKPIFVSLQCVVGIQDVQLCVYSVISMI